MCVQEVKYRLFLGSIRVVVASLKRDVLDSSSKPAKPFCRYVLSTHDDKGYFMFKPDAVVTPKTEIELKEVRVEGNCESLALFLFFWLHL